MNLQPLQDVRGITLKLTALCEFRLAEALGQLRAVPVRLGRQMALLLAYSACAEVDPYREMFFYPTDRLRIALVRLDGEQIWRRALGPGVVPGVWFCPVFPFDLDADGDEELWFVNNLDDEHPFGLSSYRLERLDARTGETTGRWPWPHDATQQCPSHLFRNFIFGGHVDTDPVLVTAQGTYGDMFLQGWGIGMEPRWRFSVGRDEPGARGSHMCAIADLDGDGRQEVLWGERCVQLDDGFERFCADHDSYRGHSDVVQPFMDRQSGRWYIFACREGDPTVSPRVACYDREGQRLWGAIDQGHMDMGWVARLGPDGSPVAAAVRIGRKSAGPDGFRRAGVEEFAFDALSGEPLELPLPIYGGVPADLDGDGLHELVRARSGTEVSGEVLRRDGKLCGEVRGRVAAATHFGDWPGEQLVTWSSDGVVRVLADADAKQSLKALGRFEHPLYIANRRLTAAGYNLHSTAGI